jgi:hypothetical protein
MGIHDLAKGNIDALFSGDVVADELMQPSDADAAAPFMDIVVIVADMKEVISVIEYSNPDQSVVIFLNRCHKMMV